MKQDLWGQAEGSAFSLSGEKRQPVEVQNNPQYIGDNENRGQPSTIGCPWKSFGSTGLQGGLCEKRSGVAPCRACLAPASSTMEETGMGEHQGQRGRGCSMRSRYSPRGTAACRAQEEKPERKEQQEKPPCPAPNPWRRSLLLQRDSVSPSVSPAAMTRGGEVSAVE